MCARALLLLLSMLAAMSASATEDEIREALGVFLDAFERGDVEAMRDAFADDAVTFPRAIMAPRTETPIDVDRYRRVAGIDPQMIELVTRLRESGATPPLLRIEPRDLDIRLSGDMALVTFHLVGAESIGRRSFVMVRRDAGWKILHLHASTVRAGD